MDCIDAPWRITLGTNPDYCNLHCIMCDTHSPFAVNKQKRGILPIEVAIETINSAAEAGLKEVIPSTMGEPLLYPYFVEIIETVADRGLKINLTTNGTFAGLGVKKWAEFILPVASDVKISINGATAKTAESIMKGLDFKKQIRDAQTFLKMRDEYMLNRFDGTPTVTMQATYMRSNLEELPAMVKMAIDMGFDRFKGHHVWITNPKMEDESLRNDKWTKRWNETVTEMQKIAKGRIKLSNVHPMEKNMPVDPLSVCPFLGKECWIESDGSFEVCCCPDEERKAFGDFGNVCETPIMKIWNSPKYRDFVADWGNYGPCEHCNMRVRDC